LIGLTAVGASTTSVTVSSSYGWVETSAGPSLEELAENTALHLLPRPGFELIAAAFALMGGVVLRAAAVFTAPL
jgi:hypothetical protein